MGLARVVSEQEIFEIFHETCNNSRLPFVSKGERKVFPRTQPRPVTAGWGNTIEERWFTVSKTMSKSCKLWCLVLSATLVLAAVALVPAEQAHAATSYGYKFSLLANGTNKSAAKKKVRTGAATGTVKKDGTNLLMLRSVGVVLRVHAGSTTTKASKAATFYSCTSKNMAYFSGYGAKNKAYSLWGQVASVGGTGNTGTTVSGTWIP